MKLLLFSILCFYIAVVFSNEKDKTINSYIDIPYATSYANFQRNSYISFPCLSSGRLRNKREIITDFDEIVSPPTTLLAQNDLVGIQLNPFILLYKDNKLQKDFYIKESGVSVVTFGNDFISVIENSGYFNLFKYNYSLYTDKMLSGSIAGNWYPRLNAIINNGVFSIQQFCGRPPLKEKKFSITFTKYGQGLPEWSIGADGYLGSTLLTHSLDNVIYTKGNNVYVLNTQSGIKVAAFDIALTSLLSSSLSLTDELVIHGINKEKREILCLYDLNGNKLWEYILNNPIVNKQPPVCGEEKTVFFISNKSLHAIKNGKLLWQVPVKECSNPLITVCKNNNIILQAGHQIRLYNSTGKEKFSVLLSKDLKEEFTAPPVIDGNGVIYTASNKALYSF